MKKYLREFYDLLVVSFNYMDSYVSRKPKRYCDLDIGVRYVIPKMR